MITLERFKKIIEAVKQFDKENKQLSKILLKDNYGFIDFYFPLIDAIGELLNEIFQPEDKELISWWLYEDVEKVVHWFDEDIRYDLTKIEDLYFYLIKQYNKVKKITRKI